MPSSDGGRSVTAIAPVFSEGWLGCHNTMKLFEPRAALSNTGS